MGKIMHANVPYSGRSREFISITQAAYDALSNNEKLDPNKMYFISDASVVTASELKDLSDIDIDITSLASGQKLVYNSATQKWGNGTGIILTYDNDFRGATLTCTHNSTSFTKTIPSTGNSMIIKVNEIGTWTLTAIVDNIPYSTEVEVETLTETTDATLQTIPDGSTVIPTDDIPMWLKCAGITDKSYTTLAEVLNDTDTFTALLQDSNACDYMARSTTWNTTICADADAMARIGKYDYCSCALLGNSTWASAIANSTYWESVLQPLVPKMTGTTTPSGEAIFSTQNTTNSFYAWKAFDRVKEYSTSTDKWVATTQTNQYVGYTFTSPVIIRKIYLLPDIYNSKSCAKDIKIEGSNDGSTWETLDTRTLADQTTATDIYFAIDNDTAYSSYRVYVSNMYVSASGISISLRCVQFYGRTEPQTNIIHSAASDTLYYIDGTNQTIGTTDTSGVGTVDWSNVPVGNLTIYSSVANDPDDLTSAYSKTVRITPHTVEVYVMPDNTLYWWGYQSSDYENASTANGWSYSTHSYNAPTYQTNYINVAGGSSKYSGLATKSKIASGTVAYMIGQGVTMNESNYYGSVYAVKTKSYTDSSRIMGNISSTSISTIQATLTADAYIAIGVASTGSFKCYAWWYE